MANINKFDKNISLIGFMGCGKTTIGTHLADMLDMKCFDTDCEIEKDVGAEISQIFEICGESYFRKLEKEKIKQLSENRGIIITTGGGAVLDPENISMLKKNGIIIYLQATYTQIFNNLKNDNTRPLLNVLEKKQIIKEMLERRAPLYENACDYIVEVVKKDISSILDNIEMILGL